MNVSEDMQVDSFTFSLRLNQAGWIIHLDAAGCRLFNLTRAEYTGKSIAELTEQVRPELRELWAGLNRQPAGGDGDHSLAWQEQTATDPAGSNRRFHTLRIPLMTSDGLQSGWLILGLDSGELRPSASCQAERFRIMFQEHSAIMLLIDPATGAIVEANNAAVEFYGYPNSSLCSMNISQINLASPEETALRQKQAIAKQVNHFTFQHRRADGHPRRVSVYSSPILIDGKNLLFSIIYDITEQVIVQEQLAQNEIDLEQQRAALEESNIALKVLLRETEQQRKNFEERVSANILGLIEPYLEKLKKSELNLQQTNYVGIIESNLKTIVSPFVRGTVAMRMKLTPAEIQISNLIRQGRSSKEIAGLLHLSPRTIDKHRSNIRKKIGATNQKINLKTLLLG